MIHGTDEAGRGPLVGPLVLVIASFQEGRERELLELGVKDSKLLTPKKREGLEKEILKMGSAEYAEVPASGLNVRMRSSSLNKIEAEEMGKLIGSKEGTVYIDLPSTNLASFLRDLGRSEGIVAEHKADSKYPAVAAASILAKVRRDLRIAELRERFGDFGSGYPSDERTISFISKPENMRALRPYIRERWSTLDRIFQTRLNSF